MLRKYNKAQSTAEYAVVIGLVVAVAAGVLQVALKKGMMRKQSQAIGVLDASGTAKGTSNVPDWAVLDKTTNEADLGLYSQSARKTTVEQAGYKDEKVTQKGGIEKSHSKSTSTTTAVDIETLNKAVVPDETAGT